MIAKYRFYVTYNSTTTEVFPLDFGKCKFQDTQEMDQGQVFYRRKLNQKITFVDNITNGTLDYSYFKAIEQDPAQRCGRITLLIRKRCTVNLGDAYADFWIGYFTTARGSFDLDRCEFSIKPEVLDEYSCLLSNFAKEVNVLEDENEVSTQTIILPDYEYFFCRSASNVIISGCGTCSGTMPLPTSSWKELYRGQDCSGYICILIRERAVVNCQGGAPVAPSGSGWQLLTDDCAGTNTATWVRQPLTYWNYNANFRISAGGCTGSGGSVEQLPPAQICEDVELQSNGDSTVNDILGTTAHCANQFQNFTFKHQVKGCENSVYLWSTSHPFLLTILAGQGTQMATLQTEFNNYGLGSVTVTVTCTETTPCGDVITHERDVSLGNLMKPTFDDCYIIGPDYVCPEQSGVKFTIPEPYQYGAGYPWTMNSNFGSIVSGNGTAEITVDFHNNGVQGALVDTASPIPQMIQLIGVTNSVCGTIIIPGSFGIYKDVFVRSVPNTLPINGLFDVCPGCQVKYDVYNRSGSTFEWTVLNGVILSGQGTNEVIVEWDNPAAGDGRILVKETVDNDCSCVYIELVPCGDNGEPPYYWCYDGSAIEYTHSHLLMEVLEFILSEIACPDVQGIVSDFFEWNPVGDAPGYVAGLNYVNNLTNEVSNLTLSAKSDIINPTASNPATRAMLTIERALQWLKEMFQVYWIIENGHLRLEHISYFEYPVGLDLTQAKYARDTRSKNKYDHLAEEKPKFERYKFAEARNTDFVGAEIRYESLCVSQDARNNVREHSADQLTTDVEFINTSPADIDKNGFVMFANTFNGTSYTVITDVGALSGLSHANAPLSWANLHDAFHRHHRALPEGFLNENLITFDSYEDTIKQADITIKLCCEVFLYNPREKVRTELGSNKLSGIFGHVVLSEYDPVGEVLKLQLGYPY